MIPRRADRLQGNQRGPDAGDHFLLRTRNRSRVADGTVMVILDSDHRAEHVLEEMRLYGPMVPVGSYLIVQDSNIGGHPVSPEQGPGPMEAIEEFLAESDAFRSDRTRERFLFSFHPKGYLRRIQ